MSDPYRKQGGGVTRLTRHPFSTQIGFLGRIEVDHVPDEGLLIKSWARIGRAFELHRLYVQQFITATDAAGKEAATSSGVAGDLILETVTTELSTTSGNKGMSVDPWQWNGRRYAPFVNCKLFCADGVPDAFVWNEFLGETSLLFRALPSLFDRLEWRVPPVGQLRYVVTVSAQFIGYTKDQLRRSSES